VCEQSRGYSIASPAARRLNLPRDRPGLTRASTKPARSARAAAFARDNQTLFSHPPREEVADRSGPSRSAGHAAPLIVALTLSGVKGTERSRTPIASNTAFEMAEGTTAAAGSPAPHGRSFGRSIRS
jgi:hypothetical protein